MKNLYKVILPALAGLVLYSSCNSRSGMALTKRRYNTGYYVDHVAAAPSPVAVEKPAVSESLHPVAPLAAPAGAVSSDAGSLADAENKASHQAVSAQALHARTQKVKHQHVAKAETAVPASPRTLGIAPVTLDMLQTYAKNPFQLKYVMSKIKKANADDAGDDARSLFWVIILLILILWLIGVIAGGFGLGELIHILLVIALVLFILWLLRIL